MCSLEKGNKHHGVQEKEKGAMDREKGWEKEGDTHLSRSILVVLFRFVLFLPFVYQQNRADGS